mmetsp:Transcript_19587/g.25261  ORF Transcript_19587/g.25261 Transcript_19587/m.25261 type:complete len:287 (+) Transcript_19587:115-975(+)|eukprot:CAMPEP_0198142590 /NCGR_PEP_ID=MMETSP1443-20131203/5340_1 /TAXON_ID=186043 /ORGANISM="Entomoneis sp., Strain CCMP2396" /LENGTH=286 /DNA_ID=CAMNT_0043805637 /DNA_START=52 /DNA_END=912 /DNA_ORIENTATION=-
MTNRFLVTAATSALLFSLGCESFSFSQMQTRKASSSALALKESDDESSSRRDFFSQVVASAAFLGGVGNGLFTMPSPASAVSGLNKVNAKLKAYGLPGASAVADGMTPLLELYGKGFNRFPILVTFNHPITWVVTIPNVDANGEDGTIQAGEYAKGDTATLYVWNEAGHVNDIGSQPKELFEKALMNSIGQKGSNMYQNFKVTKLEPITVDGQEYVRADFRYQLLTGAGFEVDRKGVASITSQGNAVEVLWSASTAIRYKKTEQQLRDIVASFRCYTDGIKQDGSA